MSIRTALPPRTAIRLLRCAVSECITNGAVRDHLDAGVRGGGGDHFNFPVLPLDLVGVGILRMQIGEIHIFSVVPRRQESKVLAIKAAFAVQFDNPTVGPTSVVNHGESLVAAPIIISVSIQVNIVGGAAGHHEIAGSQSIAHDVVAWISVIGASINLRYVPPSLRVIGILAKRQRRIRAR